MFENFKKKMKELKRKTTTLYLAYFHKDVSWYKKAFILLILIYAFSPIDLIPDFIPVIGMLDDLIIIPFGVWIAIKMVPKEIWQECEKQSEQGVKVDRKYKIAGLIIICSIWGVLIYKLVRLFL